MHLDQNLQIIEGLLSINITYQESIKINETGIRMQNAGEIGKAFADFTVA